MPVINEILDRKYQILSEIGRGGGGIVFLGYHLTLGKYVVIKKIKEQAADVLEIRGEADTLKHLSHQYLPQVYDFLVIGREIFTVMDYVNGHDLNWYMEQGVIFSEEELVRLLRQLCRVLEYLHGQTPPIIHRDIKPGNIMLRENGDVCLIDFNISFSENSRNCIGYSYQFAPPEQIEAANRAAHGDAFSYMPDARTDIYSLGATFFYLMTGVRPKDISEDELKKGRVKTAYSPELFRIIQKAMAQTPKKRYSGAAKMRRAVERSFGRARRLLLEVVSGGAVILLLLIFMMTADYRRTQREEAFASDYAAYVENLASGDTQIWISEGLSLLNEETYVSVLEKKPVQKAVILEGIANGYYEEKNYRAAADYYKECIAIRTDPIKKAEDVRNLVISLARTGDRAEAEQILSLYRTSLSSSALQYLEVEFLLQKGQKTEALKQIDFLLTSMQDRELLLRCCLHGAECLRGTEEYTRRIEYLDQAEQYIDTVLLYRRIGDGYLHILQEEPKEEIRRMVISRAEKCYEKLCADGIYAGYVDRLNLAAIRQIQGEYESAWQILKKLLEEYPDDYRAYRDAAFLRYQMEIKKTARSRSSQPVSYYGGLAFEHYDEKTGDEQMVRLQELMDSLSSGQRWQE